MKVSELKEILKNANDMDDVHAVVHVHHEDRSEEEILDVGSTDTFNRVNITSGSTDQFRVILHVETVNVRSYK